MAQYTFLILFFCALFFKFFLFFYFFFEEKSFFLFFLFYLFFLIDSNGAPYMSSWSKLNAAGGKWSLKNTAFILTRKYFGIRKSFKNQK